jgi:hypothetical protein
VPHGPMGEPVYTPEPPPYLVAFADCGPDKGCCGLIMPAQGSDGVELLCNECGFVMATVPTITEAESTLMRIAMNDAVCSLCTVCGETNVFTGFDEMLMFTCRHCGSALEVKRSVQ